MQDIAPNTQRYAEAAKAGAKRALAPIRPTVLAGERQRLVHAHMQKGMWVLDRAYGELAEWHHDGELDTLILSLDGQQLQLHLASASQYQHRDAFVFSSALPGADGISVCTFIVYADGTVAWGTEDVGNDAITVKGYASAEEIGAMHGMAKGDIWGLTDDGTIARPGQDPLPVQAGDLVQWDGSMWQLFLHLDLTNYVTEQELQDQVEILNTADAALQGAIDTHAGRTDNPHQVTATQIGAATSNDLLRMRYAATNTLRFYRGAPAS